MSDEDFPYNLVEHLGYHIYHHGQKGHYGVALLLKQEPKVIRRGFSTDDENAQKAYNYGGFRNRFWVANSN